MKKPIFGGEFPSEEQNDDFFHLGEGGKGGLKGRNYLKIYSKNVGM